MQKKISFEIFPPKKTEALENIDTLLQELCKHKPDYISVTYGAGGTGGKNATLDIAQKITEKYSTQSMVHLTCLHQTQTDIASLCDQFSQAGIKNILALRGDRQEGTKECKDFTYASDLVRYLKKEYTFTIWAACYPEGHVESKNLEEDLNALSYKVSCGVDRLISQLFFDTGAFCSFLDKARGKGISVPIDAGIMPVLDATRVKKMVSMSNAKIPGTLQKILDLYEDDSLSMYKAGIDYAVQQIHDITVKTESSVHLYVMNNSRSAKDIIRSL